MPPVLSNVNFNHVKLISSFKNSIFVLQEYFFEIKKSVLKPKIKDFFSFSKTERNGIIVLLGIIVILMFIPRLFPLFRSHEQQDFSKFEKEIIAFEKQQKKIERKDYHEYNKDDKDFDFTSTDHSVAESKLSPFNFNPNEMTDEQWRQLGLTERQIKTLDKYSAKGGKFFKKEDFKKMYCISESEYNVLEPYIQIPDKKTEAKSETKPESKFEKKNSRIVELNSADTSDLKTLKGIGPSYARRIVKYRTKLGGFINPEQLKEISGLDTTYYKFADFIKVNRFLVEKININTCTFDQLKNHPYVGYNIAFSLMNYRKMHGKFKTVSDIKNSALVTETVYQKISPYLETE